MKYTKKVEVLKSISDCNVVQLLDGFERALVGFDIGSTVHNRPIYDYDKCIDILMKRDKMKLHEAIEYIDFNVIGALNQNDPDEPILMKTFKDMEPIC